MCIVDRDVFQPYLNNDRIKSLDRQGIPLYKPEIKSSSPIYDLISDVDKQSLLDCLITQRYGEALNILKKYSIISMRYAIEVDLLVCSSYVNAYCDVLQVSENNRSSLFLATERKNKIKKLEVVNKVLNRTTVQNYPKSYKQIVKLTREMIKQSK